MAAAQNDGDAVVPVEEVQKIFRFLDTDHSGFIEINELRSWVAHEPLFEKDDPDQKSQALMKVMDKDEDGKISLQDFTTHFEKMKKAGFAKFFKHVQGVEVGKIIEMFRLLDLDGNGYIDKSEFSDWVKNEVSVKEDESKLFASIDQNNNDKISVEELVEYYQNFTQEQLARATESLYKRHAGRLTKIRTEMKEDSIIVPPDEAEAKRDAEFEEARLKRQPEEPVPPEQQRDTIRKILDQNKSMQSKVGERWYAVSSKWYDLWKQFVGFDSDADRNHPTDKDGNVVLNGDEDGMGQPQLERRLSFTLGQRPGHIDNSDIQGERAGELRLGVSEGYDFVLLPEDAWNQLREWYGGSPVFPRYVIQAGNETRVELHPAFFTTVWADPVTGVPSAKTVGRHHWSQSAKIKTALEDMAAEHKKATGRDVQVRLWIKANMAQNGESAAAAASDGGEPAADKDWVVVEQDNQWVLVPDEALEEEFGQSMHVTAGSTVLFEAQNELGKWPRQKFLGNDSGEVAIKKDWKNFEIGDIIDAQDSMGKWFESTVREVKDDKIFVHFEGWSSKWDEWLPRSSDRMAKLRTHTTERYVSKTQAQSYDWQKGAHSAGAPEAPGVVGLRNLGNTCFMNSTLQCLSNTKAVTDYFVSDAYKKDLNKENPLGHMGRVAEEYASLVKELWCGKYTVVAPARFKHAIGEFAPRFSGYQQQDSSELLSFLLDGLHEDLNRVKKKPYTQEVESKGRDDAIVAKEAWETYLLRNESLVTDMLTGQLKSTIVCPKKECGRVSIKFDPFLFLSVPLPIVSTKTIPVTVFPYDAQEAPTLYGVTISKHASIGELSLALKELCGKDKLVFCDMSHHRIYKVLPERTSVSEIRDSDVIYAYELPEFEVKVADEPTDIEAWRRSLKVGDIIDAKDTDRKWMESVIRELKEEGGKRLAFVHYCGWATKWDEWLDLAGDRVAPKNKISKPSTTILAVVHLHAKNNPHYPQDRYHLEPFLSPFYIGFQSNVLTNNGVYELMAKKTKAFMKEPAASEAKDGSKYPFDILITSRGHDTCGLCGKYDCSGCLLPQNDDMMELPSKASFGIHWKDVSRLDEEQATKIERHESAPKPGAGGEVANTKNLADCLDEFTKGEILSKEDAWYCSNCKEHQQASKKFDIYKTPDVMIIHLKRFSFTRLWREKLDSFIDFPLEGLDMSPWVIKNGGPKPIYDCFAVSNHLGGMGGGHYTAYCRNPNGKWYHFDDSHVSEAAPGQVKTRAAYLLFYKLRKPGDSAATSAASAASS